MVGKLSGLRNPAAGFILRLCRMLRDEALKNPSGSTPEGQEGNRERESPSGAATSNSNNGGNGSSKGGGKTGAPAASKQQQPVLESIAKSLESCEAWQQFSADPDPWAEDGSRASSTSHLSRLIKEQDDDLCGPKPIRPPPITGDAMADEAGMGELAEMAGGGLMSGREILALLQGMGRL